MRGFTAMREMRNTVLTGVLATVLVGGCASLTQSRGTSPLDDADALHNSSRAEQVFRYQSRIANAVLDHYPLFTALEDANGEVAAAEEKMADACSALTQAVLARFAGEELSFAMRLRVMTSIDTCERAAREMDVLLHDVPLANAD